MIETNLLNDIFRSWRWKKGDFGVLPGTAAASTLAGKFGGVLGELWKKHLRIMEAGRLLMRRPETGEPARPVSRPSPIRWAPLNGGFVSIKAPAIAKVGRKTEKGRILPVRINGRPKASATADFYIFWPETPKAMIYKT